MNIGHKLKELRISKNMSLQDVADKVGVSKTTLMRWENGETQKMPSKKIDILAKTLNINPLYIVLGDDKYLERRTTTSKQLLDLYYEMDNKQQEMLIQYAKFILKENDAK